MQQIEITARNERMEKTWNKGTETENINEGGGLAGLAWHTSPMKISPGKAAALANDNSFKITIPSSKPADTIDGNYLPLNFW